MGLDGKLLYSKIIKNTLASTIQGAGRATYRCPYKETHGIHLGSRTKLEDKNTQTDLMFPYGSWGIAPAIFWRHPVVELREHDSTVYFVLIY